VWELRAESGGIETMQARDDDGLMMMKAAVEVVRRGCI
jgi:hypothetical protein